MLWLSQHLHSSTLIIVTTLLSAASALMMLIVYLGRPDAKGLRTWLFSNLAYTFGFLCLMLSFAPSIVQSLVANMLINAGACLGYLAVCQFVDRSTRAWRLLAVAAALMALECLLYFVEGTNYRLMVVSECAIRGLATAGAGWSLLRFAPPALRPASTVSAAFHFLWVSMLATRALWWLFAGFSDTLLEPTTSFALIARILLTFVVTPSYLWMIARELDAELIRQARQDPLTGIFNRRAMWESGEKSIAEAMRKRRTTALMMIDIDHFKLINDSWGHDMGDRALVAVAETLAKHVDAQDIVARVGGEEFMVLMADTDGGAVVATAERVRQAIEASAIQLPNGRFMNCTVSIGCAMFDQDGRRWTEIVSAADRALYAAKRGGRNRVSTAGAIQSAVA